ncbi:hypothetical protein [Atlantibacter hermannii]|uniref:hypothetical protein n=1 Tax=Atlantibacter hermannii TaxID=565 RepID=UPI0034D4DA00
MGKVITHWNVFIATRETYESGESPMLIGHQSTPDAVIEHGFLLHENLNGAKSGINLSEVLAFSIEPQFKE